MADHHDKVIALVDAIQSRERPALRGTVVLTDRGIEVVNAPPAIGISLELLRHVHDRGITVHGNRISFGSLGRRRATYLVVGWDADDGCLLALLVEDTGAS